MLSGRTPPLVVDEAQEEVAAPLAVADMDAPALYEAARQYLSPFAWKKHDPENSAALINALIERGLEHGAALSLLLANLTDLLIVLAPDSRARLRKAITAAHDAIRDESEEDKRTAARLESARLTLQLYDAEPADQSALVLSSGLDAERGEWLLLCQLITLGDLAQVDLKSVPASHLAGWLDYVGGRLSKEEIAELDFLPELITHSDQSVRHNALTLAAHGRHLPALEVFAASPYSASPSGEDKPNHQHEYWRNRATP